MGPLGPEEAALGKAGGQGIQAKAPEDSGRSTVLARPAFLQSHSSSARRNGTFITAWIQQPKPVAKQRGPLLVIEGGGRRQGDNGQEGRRERPQCSAGPAPPSPRKHVWRASVSMPAEPGVRAGAPRAVSVPLRESTLGKGCRPETAPTPS